MLDRLVTVVDAAGAPAWMLMSTLFTGHMSGVNWMPGWAMGGAERDARFRVVSGGRVVEGDGLRNWYGDADVAQAQAMAGGRGGRGARRTSGRVGLGSGQRELELHVPPDREARAAMAVAAMTAAIRAADRGRPITIGIHMEDLEEDRRLGPAEAAEACDFLTMHGYPIYAAWS